MATLQKDGIIFLFNKIWKKFEMQKSFQFDVSKKKKKRKKLHDLVSNGIEIILNKKIFCGKCEKNKEINVFSLQFFVGICITNTNVNKHFNIIVSARLMKSVRKITWKFKLKWNYKFSRLRGANEEVVLILSLWIALRKIKIH